MKTLLALVLLPALYFQPCDAREPVADYGAPRVLPTPPASVYGFQAEQVADGVFSLNQGNEFHIQPRGNVGVVLQTQGVVLVDSGGSPDGAEQVIAFVRSLTDKPVTAIVITHWHGDRALGVSRLLEEWPQARVISTGPTRDMLGNPQADKFMPGDDAEANAVYLANIEDGVNHLRDTAKNETLDAVERSGFAQAAEEYAQFGREMQRAHRVAPTEVFDRALTLDDQTHPLEVRFPGHGRPLHDAVYADSLVTMLADVRAQVAPLAPTAMDTAAVIDAVNLDAASNAAVGDDPWMRRWFRDYWKGPIVSSALREARGEPIVQGAD